MGDWLASLAFIYLTSLLSVVLTSNYNQSHGNIRFIGMTLSVEMDINLKL